MDSTVERFSFEFSRPLSWPLAFLGVTPWTAHVDVRGDELAVRFGPWSLVTPMSNVEGAQITGPYLPFRVLGPHVSLADRGVTFGTSWRRGVCVRFKSPVAAALPAGLLHHPAATLTVEHPERLVALLEQRAQGAQGAGDEPRRAPLQTVPTGSDVRPSAQAEGIAGADDVGDAAADPAADVWPTPVAMPPVRRTPRPTERTARRRTPTPVTGTSTGTSTGTDTDAGPGTGTSTRTTTRARRRPAAAAPEHPTPADMPLHTPTEKVPGVTPPADEGLPGPDSES